MTEAFANRPPLPDEARGVLMQDATKAATWRGHEMGSWVLNDDTRASATCSRCGAWVGVDVSPSPNGINVWGRAVAVECEGG